ncbi:immediate early response gene 5-like protein [Physella acuta]|uniref:immediate early response gene 5-like protein n=1 Tax=Physella acuta TaxID=109671 RepID=UPI0027DE7AA5|nr:immediate early response gene 5-like protein [Physella acuta]
MAASIETQRLISVSLGKIAQSRGQRGGINLHKNLLVATVLHKARTAYMMESYNYQQNLHRQKLQQGQQQAQFSSPVVQNNSSTLCSNASNNGEVCQTPHDSNLVQPTATPTASVESRSEISATTGHGEDAHEPMTIQETHDKENAPPARYVISDKQEISNSESKQSNRPDDHLTASNLLSLEVQSASLENQVNTPTACNILKRRRDNPSTGTQDKECPANKKARVSYDSQFSKDSYLSDFDLSSDESDSEPELDVMHTSDSPQITNLVTIFNSGFSGLCAVVNGDSDSDSSGYQSDLDISGSSQFTPIPKLRPESPSPSYSRKHQSDSSLLCSSQVGRLDTLPNAIVLSA